MTIFSRTFFASIALFFSACLHAEAREIQSSLQDCNRPVIPVDEKYSTKWDFNAANVSLAYGVFAAVSADAYADDKEKALYLPTKSLKYLGWEPLKWQAGSESYRFSSRFTGLSFDTYSKERGDCVFIILAIRGTDWTAPNDWFSNLSWLTNIIPVNNQYRQIDDKFEEVRDYAERKFSSRKIKYIATGHSLGGGLANHVAKCFDDVSAVVFNSSFVHNSMSCKPRKTTIIEIYDNEEVLARVRSLTGTSRKKHTNNDELSTYGINPYENKKGDPIAQHSIDAMALSMLRMSLDCEKEGRKCYTSPTLVKENLDTSNFILCKNFDKNVSRNGRKIFYFRDVCEM